MGLPIEQDWRDWALALLVFCAATAFDYASQFVIGGSIPWLIYCPALAFTAVFAGLGPSLLVLVGALLVVVTFWIEPYGVPFRIAHLSDSISTVVFGVAGVVICVVSTFARRLLRRSSLERLHMDIALTTGNMVAWTWDVRSGKMSYSSNAARLFGMLPTRLDEVLQLMHPDDLERVKGVIGAALREGDEYSFLARKRPEGDRPPRWTHTHGHVLRDARGRATNVRGVTADVTDLASTQEQLRLEVQRKDNFLATLAHELRNPMAPIRYATAMLGEEAPPEKRQWARDVIARQSAHMARLLDDLLDMSRITRDVIELHPELFDLRTAIGHAVDNARAAISARGHDLQVELPPAPVCVKGDVTRIQQILGNLLDNAAKYTPNGGRLRVLLQCEDRQAIVRVADNGIGIAPAQQSRVFDLFTQLHEPGRNAGLGIGLALVKRLVELHGGVVGVHSEGPGCGSEFTIRLPQHGDAADPGICAAPRLAPERFERTHSIVVVDDNADTADTLGAVLRGTGYKVRSAKDGHEALRAFEQLRPAAVVLDLGLPDLSGTEVAEQMRSRAGRAVCIVAVTGWDQFRDQSDPPLFDLVLVKPVDPAELQRRLDTLIAKPVIA
jgi:PAS domain S-box-containing protein